MLEASSNNIIVKCWAKQITTTTANIIVDQNQIVHGMVSVSTQCLLYKASSTSSSNNFVYYVTSKGEFKTWYNNHKESFRHRECINETELSKHVCWLSWFWLSWEIHKKASLYQCGSKRCDLCLSEKVSIICADPNQGVIIVFQL